NKTELSFVLWEKGGKSLKDYESFNASSVSFIVGPEGGLDTEEIEILKEKGFKPIYLGKRILRAETAAIAGMALVQYIWGDLGGE
ncbi:MAG: RsmE family RNA methyltransferase, partial [Desulfurobacteriaceae bacterium]